MENQTPMTAYDFSDRMERLYPESAALIAPYAREMVNELSEEAVEAVSTADIGRMADEAMRKSGMAVNIPAGHSAGTLSDLTRALVVRELIDRSRRGFGGRDGRFPFLFPFFFFPFDGRGFDGRGFDGRGFDHRFGPPFRR